MHLSNYYFAPEWLHKSYAWLQIHAPFALTWQEGGKQPRLLQRKNMRTQHCKSWQVEGEHTSASTPILGHLLPQEKNVFKTRYERITV